MNNKTKIVAVLGALAVGIGAFGAHGLKPHLDQSQLEAFKTASFYHFIHIIAMLIFLISGKADHKVINTSFWLFLIGIMLFSGSLYTLSTKHLYGWDIPNIGFITPIGGIVLLAGWINLLRYRQDLG
ncbi:MAG: DUF423 domain-containing protein [Saprospiraceae bacterium]|nr:DUF423 domain-containing protein [Saprospiraceae bacterium]